MSTSNKSARGAQGKNVLLTNAKNSAKDIKKKGSTLVYMASSESKAVKEEKDEIQDAVIIEETTATQEATTAMETTTAPENPDATTTENESPITEEPAELQPRETAEQLVEPQQNPPLPVQMPLSVDDIIEKADRLQRLTIISVYGQA